MTFDVDYYNSTAVLFVTFIATGFLIVYNTIKWLDGDKKSGKKGDKANDVARDEKGNETKQFFSKDFVTLEDLKTNKGFNYNTFTSLKECNDDGILVRADASEKGMAINFIKPIHTLVIGTTSSGKTSRFVVPSLQLMACTASKPSFVITDPKGELYEKCARHFASEGYDVKVLNLTSPFSSSQWNPLSYPYEMFQRSYNLDKEVKVHPAGDNPNKYDLNIQRPFDYNSTNWFEFNRIAYADKDALENDMRVLAKELRDQTYTALDDVSTSLIPINNKNDSSWETTAQKLVHGVMEAMLEDSLDPELGMTKEKFIPYNVYKVVNTSDAGRETYKTLKEYLFSYRDEFSPVKPLCNTALNNADNTSKNYMGFAISGMSLFTDMGISYLTCASEIDFAALDEKPTAIFLIIPDEIRTRYPLAILFITQLYKRLVEKCRYLKGNRLRRNVYFMLEEFGNMPKFPNFGSSMAVGRSRGIFFELIVQSYSQLNTLYGNDEGKVIRDNCPIQVYIASEDMQTNKEFSELLGKKTIAVTNKTTQKGADGKDIVSSSVQNQSVPIVSPEELMTFKDKGEILVKSFAPNAAIKAKSSSIYDDSTKKYYDMQPLYMGYVPKHEFDANKVFYDIKKRNEILNKRNASNDDDDDDFDF